MGQLAAQRLTKAGAAVAALDINEAGLTETAKGFDSIHCFTVDVTDIQAVNDTVNTVEKDLGPIDRVIIAAAIMPFWKLPDQPTERIHKLMAINYGGLVNVSKATLPRMLVRKSGDFISFSSLLGQMPTLLTGGYGKQVCYFLFY